ncbi:MAG: hypothetical protein GF375_02015 [Candidatus Omnitrophica bacterium]|nr:hypothetical protein [Candidatus Omnitrophota bacterium]
MREYRKKRKAQSIVEMGLFGIVIISAFALVVTYLGKMNKHQYAIMESFRRALKWAHDNNVITSHGHIDDDRTPDATAPIRKQRMLGTSSNYVHWAVSDVEGLVPGAYLNIDPDREFHYRHNYTNYEFSPDANVTGAESGYTTAINESFDLGEDEGSIWSTRTVSVNEDLHYDIIGAGALDDARSTGGSRSFYTGK